jgi:ABC-type multidrug transport system ATPase subunit
LFKTSQVFKTCLVFTKKLPPKPAFPYYLCATSTIRMSAIVKVTALSKEFKDVSAVNNLSFTVEEGDIYGFLGQNGAGKSTTIRMLLTLITPTSGHIEIFGKALHLHRREVLRNTGAVIEKPDLYKYLSALENIRIFSRLSGSRHTDKQLMEQLDQVGLAARAKSTVKTFSQGMKQRLGIAVALVHNPQLVILDEPVNGLDPQGIADMRNLILRLNREQKRTLVVSSHLLGEMELVATRMLIISKGKKVVEGGVQELLSPAKVHVELVTDDNAKAMDFINGSRWKEAVQPVSNKDKIVLELEREDIARLSAQIVQAGVGIQLLKPRHSLEDYFLQLTGS